MLFAGGQQAHIAQLRQIILKPDPSEAGMVPAGNGFQPDEVFRAALPKAAIEGPDRPGV